ncbi:MAG: diaminopimelate epimerase [Vicinamibacteria bacterium]
MMGIAFAKGEAHGNDFLLVAHDQVRALDPAPLARAICHRLRGVGGDGLIVYRAGEGDFSMTLFNTDGSLAEISGNGLRCLAAYLVYRGLAAGDSLEVATGAGRLSLSLAERDQNRFRFRANMGKPRSFEKGVALDVDGETFEATTVSLGNPHLVLFTDSYEVSELRRLGPRIENHPRFPDRTNVELVEVVGPSEIRMGIWERGVGETASSGTGSSASAVASILNGRVKSPVRVHCEGGVLKVEWEDGGDVFLTGDAIVVAEGSYLLGGGIEPDGVSLLERR